MLFALEVIRLVESSEPGLTRRVVASQLVRCATSVAMNYRAAQRAQSTADFIKKLKIVEEEADETCGWLEIIQRAGLMPKKDTTALSKEANEITAIVVASIKTARQRKQEGG
ncbi:MAG: four helix bundle protein [Chthonomonas sp.]|nr:four helix bundle protein [Chthonomonas sp.]